MTKTALLKRTSAAAVLLLAVVFTVSAFPGRGHAGSYAEVAGMNLENYELKDGSYTGTADGFRPGLVVEITVSGSRITEIEVIDHNEIGRQFYQAPIRLIPADIVDEQQTDVDVVSGATATSKAIMAAVEEAVNKAKK